MNRFLRTVVYGEISHPKAPQYKVVVPNWLKKKKKRNLQMSGMSLDRSMRRQEQLRARMVEVLHMSVLCCHTHGEMLERLNERVYKTPEYKQCPKWVHTYLQGYRDCYMNQVWRDLVIFSYEYQGKRYLAGTEEYRAIDPCEFSRVSETGAHVWRSNPEKFFTLPDVPAVTV